MNRKGGVKLILSIIFIILILVGIVSIFYFMSKPKINCVESSEDDFVFRFPIPGTVTMAGGKQTGAENHKFVNGEKIPVCCADVETSEGRKFKDCINLNYGEEKKGYKVVWEEVNGELLKFAESITEGELECIYNFDEFGEQSGRYCYDPNEEELNEEEKYYKNLTTQFPECDKLSNNRSEIFFEYYELSKREECYVEKAVSYENVSICDYIFSDGNYIRGSANTKELCYVSVAQKTENIEICDKFYDNNFSVTWSDYCYKLLIDKFEDPFECYDKMKRNFKDDILFFDQANQDYCFYYFVVFKEGNKSLCEYMVEDEERKEECLSS